MPRAPPYDRPEITVACKGALEAAGEEVTAMDIESRQMFPFCEVERPVEAASLPLPLVAEVSPPNLARRPLLWEMAPVHPLFLLTPTSAAARHLDEGGRKGQVICRRR